MPNHQNQFFNHHNHHNGVVVRPVIYAATPVVYSSGYNATPVVVAPVYTAGNSQVMYQPAPVMIRQRPAVVYATPCCVIL
jgi:hypothetical protein